MATGRGNQLTKQIGEYLVAAELGRRGFVAATFSGNVPDYDIVASDECFRSVLVQVKAITGTSWQFDIRRFVGVSLDEQRQVVGPPVEIPRDIVCVMVALSKYGEDRFYVLEWRSLRDLMIREHKAYLEKHGGVRPKKFDSFHAAISEKHLREHQDEWAVVGRLCA